MRPAETNLAPLSPDVAKYFPDDQSVNKALRGPIDAANGSLGRAPKPSKKNKKRQSTADPFENQSAKGCAIQELRVCHPRMEERVSERGPRRVRVTRSESI